MGTESLYALRARPLYPGDSLFISPTPNPPARHKDHIG